jgi:hypothetical protein
MSKPSTRVFGSRPAVAIASAIITAVVVSGTLSAFAQEAAELVGANQVNSASIINGQVRSVDILNGGVTSLDILNATVNSADIRDGNVTSIDIADNAVTGTDIADGSVSAADLGTDSVNSSEIAADSVGSSEIAAGIVSNDELGTITQRSTVSAAIANGAGGSATATCLAGEQVLSGGNDGVVANGYHIVASRQGGNGWTVFLRNDTGAPRTVTAHAYCLAP